MMRDQQARQTVLEVLCDTDSNCWLPLAGLSGQEWRRLMQWLDVSGLALYFLDRAKELRCETALPDAVRAGLEQRLTQNTARTHGMIAESVAIHQEFARSGLVYALLKGISLWPDSVPRLELRSQLDIDFLIAEADVAAACAVLERRGYYLHAVSGRSWEFKTRVVPNISLKNLYRDAPSRAVELHVEKDSAGKPRLLTSAVSCAMDGVAIPVLRPADQFVGQGRHVCKHIYGGFFRAAHLLEFRRHALMRREDEAFWREVQARAMETPGAWWALGVTTLLVTRLMGDFVPEHFLRWTVHRLPASVRLWVEMYGERAVLQSFPGNKLHLLLPRELAGRETVVRQELRRALMPLRLPPPIVRGDAHESWRTRLLRYWMQACFIGLRLRFHAVEGMRYAWELPRWRRCVREQAAICAANKRMTIL